MGAATARGRIVVISGPSGVGKSTIVGRLLERAPVPLVPSVSATTRPARPGEVNGKDYHFFAPEEFDRRRRRGEFLEAFEVFGRGHWYGTLVDEVASGLEAGKWVLLEIDVQGALAITERYPDAVSIFLRPPSMEELERRLRGRGTESEEAVRRRLERAKREMAMAARYRHQVTSHRNGEEQAVDEIRGILAEYATGQLA